MIGPIRKGDSAVGILPPPLGLPKSLSQRNCAEEASPVGADRTPSQISLAGALGQSVPRRGTPQLAQFARKPAQRLGRFRVQKARGSAGTCAVARQPPGL